MTEATRRVHPSVFMFLIIPFGALGGYLSVAVAYLLSQRGVSVGQIASLVALALAPHTFKFLWAPIADTTLSRKTWYLIGSVFSAAGILASGIVPLTRANLLLLGWLAFAANIGCTFLGMAVESLMAYGTPADLKGRAGGWFQAGNLGGGGIGGGAGLWLIHTTHSPLLAASIVAGVCLLCGLALLFIDEPHAEHRALGLWGGLAFVVTDLWAVARSRIGFLALVLCFLPIGSGAASGLWSAVAGDWRASADTVAFVTGVVGGFVSAAGCLVGGWVCDRMNRKAAYALFGVLQAACAVAMAFAPHSESMFIVWTTAYAFVTGLTYAGFSAFVLEAMGLGAAATKYNVFASLSNMPILYMSLVDGWAHTRWGPTGMLLTEAVCGTIGLVLLTIVVRLTPKRMAVAAG